MIKIIDFGWINGGFGLVYGQDLMGVDGGELGSCVSFEYDYNL